MKPEDVQIGAEKLAPLLSREAAETAMQNVEDPLAHFGVGLWVRNCLRHWGIVSNDIEMDNGWRDVLATAVRIRLSPNYVPTPDERDAFGDPADEDWESKVARMEWTAVLPGHSPDTVRIERVFEFYDDDTYASFFVEVPTSGEDRVTLLTFGRYEAGNGFIATRDTWCQGDRLPPGGAPYFVCLSPDGGSFEYLNYVFQRTM